ncbi:MULTISPECIES: DCC1-like thiol-disulfide oxidoreductase family protein [unclassified Chryseobacterium]|uniref:thiol-disulfide oxidoreductase DCC family protein n=1 Tax=unclassified Chryseobacterium TaxID=2593645 RepID=UPI00226A3D9E|nr:MULTISPECIES: DCC1-like thiol-disulfide oxidoreductase family protein [unclassified Chryseobacterium]
MKKLIVYYDGWCPRCTKFMKTVKKIDWLQLTDFRSLRERDPSMKGIDYALAEKQMATYDKNWVYGYESIFKILIRLPLLWLFVPVLWLMHITKIGQAIYIQLAVNRKIIPLHCDNDVCNI